MAERAKGTSALILQEVPPVVREAQSQVLYDLAIVVGAVHQQVIEPTQVILLEVSSESVADEICASPKSRSLALRRLGPRAIAVVVRSAYRSCAAPWKRTR